MVAVGDTLTSTSGIEAEVLAINEWTRFNKDSGEEETGTDVLISIQSQVVMQPYIDTTHAIQDERGKWHVLPIEDKREIEIPAEKSWHNLEKFLAR